MASAGLFADGLKKTHKAVVLGETLRNPSKAHSQMLTLRQDQRVSHAHTSGVHAALHLERPSGQPMGTRP